ncbi:hypothetical protein L596_024040 [Steinernema carpocapsae]|uniref:Uncharacterized protein n=1 Tax=Steinernema carpocapsae TaxID=34508 RepID=A0A4U5MFI0_STECR|nr:hypothetical protein L596_024040 [Steinernema carpocapsae]
MHFSSYQNHLPSTVTPGWNDPPPAANGTAGAQPATRLAQRHRRPVDPSIQTMNDGGVHSSSSTPQPLGSHPTFSSAPQLHLYQQAPHLVHVTSQPQLYPYPPPQQAPQVMSAAAAPPAGHPAAQNAPPPHSIPAPPQQQPPVANGGHVNMATHHHKAVYDAFTVPGGGF